MIINFWKYQGNGNDFVILNGRDQLIDLSPDRIALICDRHFGIGADGLMIIQNCELADFEMLYYNADGHLSSLCGNGGRCIAAFAFLQGIVENKMIFKAHDGNHNAIINHDIVKNKTLDVSLSMANVSNVIKEDGFYVLDTGSPHYVEFVDKVAEIDVIGDGRKTRYSERFSPDGINVNFVEISKNRLFVRTYERGVENETLSCGTGVTASALAAYAETARKDYSIHTTGGEFKVSFNEVNGSFESIWLRGPAEEVFKGSIDLS